MLGQPGAGGIQRAIRQQDDRPATIEVAHNRPVGLPAPESKVVDSNHRRRVIMLCDPPAHDAEQCVFADRYHETVSKTGCGPAAQSQAKVVNDRLEALRAPTIAGQDPVIELLAEYATAAENTIAPKPPRQD